MGPTDSSMTSVITNWMAADFRPRDILLPFSCSSSQQYSPAHGYFILCFIKSHLFQPLFLALDLRWKRFYWVWLVCHFYALYQTGYLILPDTIFTIIKKNCPSLPVWKSQISSRLAPTQVLSPVWRIPSALGSSVRLVCSEHKERLGGLPGGLVVKTRHFHHRRPGVQPLWGNWNPTCLRDPKQTSKTHKKNNSKKPDDQGTFIEALNSDLHPLPHKRK